MSLINQMLKDLEQRRSQLLQAEGPLEDIVPAVSVPARRRRRAPLGLALVTLAAAAAVWIWHGAGGPEPAPVAAATPAPVPAARPDPAPPAGPDPAPAPVAEAAVRDPAPAAVEARAAASVPRPVIKARAATAKPVPPAPARDESTDATGAAGGEGTVAKRLRPPTPAQRAEQAYQRGWQALRAGRGAEAEAALHEALRLNPEHLPARELLVGHLLRQGRLDEAGRLLRDGLALAPRHGTFAKLYARILARQNAVPTAIEVLRRSAPALAADPDHHAMLAALYQRQGRHAEAARLYRDLVKLRPNASVWWVGLGVSLEALGRSAEARLAYERALDTGNVARRLRDFADGRLAALGGED